MVMPGNKEKRLIPYIKEPVSFGVLQDDGNLVFYGLGAQIVWQSIDHPSDTILGGQNLRSGVDLNSVGKRLHSSITSLNATTSHFSVFEGNPAWSKTNLTYGMSPNYMIDYINRNDILMALHSSFSRWSSVVELNFTEIQAYESADIKIGFYHGDHGDGLPFTQGILAHAFEPEIGMLHFNADVVWSVDFKSERRKDAFDLESVATHEIGHLLGLNHSSDQDAVMFWSIPRRTEKRELSADDVLGVQSLYRPNANYSPNYKDASGDNSVSLVNVLVSLIITGIFM
ncbi:metalloendoproteinase 1-MMP-like [Papaver somniferum]|nr:metalloendoproteinase 1-MMP-like [Papaver somniferum]